MLQAARRGRELREEKEAFPRYRPDANQAARPPTTHAPRRRCAKWARLSMLVFDVVSNTTPQCTKGTERHPSFPPNRNAYTSEKELFRCFAIVAATMQYPLQAHSERLHRQETFQTVLRTELSVRNLGQMRRDRVGGADLLTLQVKRETPQRTQTCIAGNVLRVKIVKQEKEKRSRGQLRGVWGGGGGGGGVGGVGPPPPPPPASSWAHNEI